MFRIYGKEEKITLWKPGWILRFISEERKYAPTIKANTFYKVLRTQQIPYSIGYIIPAGDEKTIELEDIGLYPTRPESVYQIAVGIGGDENIVVYPKIPETDFFLRLEKSEYIPNPSIEDTRYIGEFTKTDSPVTEPKIEIVTVKDYETIAFLIYNPTNEDRKIIFEFIVNRCLIKEVTEEDEIKRCNEMAKEGRVRDIIDYKLLRW